MATNEKPSPKFALRKGESRGNIESWLRMRFELGHCNHLAMTWASWSLDPVDH